jgi:hypothetical protein
MPRLKITLTDDDLEAAVREWSARHNHLTSKQAEDATVTITSSMRSEGYGTSEHQVPCTQVTIEAG